MFKAIGRYFRAIGYLFTGKVDKARQALNTNPAVVQATFDKIISEKKKRITQYKDAVGAMIAQEEKKKSQLKSLTDKIVKNRKLRDGAAARAKQIVEKHNGNIEAVRSDPDYIRCQSAFKDFSSSLTEMEDRVADLEGEVGAFEKNIAGHKTQLQGLLREIEKLKSEKHETVAEMLTAKEEKEIADMLAGISQDRTSEELQELRDLRDQAKATARVSREVAGIDAKQSEEEFLEYASQSVADSEFEKLIGLTKESGEADSGAQERTQIPEG